MKGISDTLLCSLWRKACLIFWKNRCVICGCVRRDEDLQVHHLCKRSHLITRYDWRNGFPVCVRIEGKETCHQKADSKEGQDIIRRKIGDEMYFELDRLSRQTIQDYCLKTGQTRGEFLLEKKAELKGIIEGAE